LTPEQVLNLAPPTANTRLKYGRLLYELITTNHLSVGLELTSSPSISTLYLAGAIEALGAGLLRSVSQKPARTNDYDVHAALQRTHLNNFVSLYEEPRSYNWRLLKFLQDGLFEHFDFCVIDSGRTLPGVGFACCLADRLLRPGGWIVLDNINFSFRDSRKRDKAWTMSTPEDEQTIHQIRCVFELLLQENPNFGTFRKRRSVAFAQKKQAVWSSDLRSSNKREAIICDAIERARYDPEFRDELLNSPREALFLLLGSAMGDLGIARFVDTDQIAPVVSAETPEGLVVYLDRPAWEKRVDESTLNGMLQEKIDESTNIR